MPLRCFIVSLGIRRVGLLLYLQDLRIQICVGVLGEEMIEMSRAQHYAEGHRWTSDDEIVGRTPRYLPVSK